MMRHNYSHGNTLDQHISLVIIWIQEVFCIFMDIYAWLLRFEGEYSPSQNTRLIVKHSSHVDNLAHVFYKLQMRWVLVEIVISVGFGVEF
jgi:hypothetical protein